MNSAGFTAKGQAVFVAFLLYILPMAILAEDTVGANLVEVENLDSGPYLHRVSVQIGNRVEHLLLNPNPDLNDLTMINSAGEAISQPVIAYMGIVESLPASWARVVIDGSYLAGTINIAGENLHLSSEIIRQQHPGKCRACCYVTRLDTTTSDRTADYPKCDSGGNINTGRQRIF